MTPSSDFQYDDALRRHRERWRAVGQSTQTDRQLAENSVKATYQYCLDSSPATMVWVNDPLEGFIVSSLVAQVKPYQWDQMISTILEAATDQAQQRVSGAYWDQLWDSLRADEFNFKYISSLLWSHALYRFRSLDPHTKHQLAESILGASSISVPPASGDDPLMIPMLYGTHTSLNHLVLLDFLSTTQQLTFAPLDHLVNLIRACRFWWLFQGIAILCPHPQHISFDRHNQLHAQGQPALAYHSSFSLYAWHGTLVPQTYAVIDPTQWKVEWLLHHRNPIDVRQALIQAMGYEVIIQELQTQTLDIWENYELLQVPYDLDYEPIHLLKVTDPATAQIQALRVPALITSAFEAICWINLELSSDEFELDD